MAGFMADSSPLVHSHNVTHEHERVYAVTDVGLECATSRWPLYFLCTHKQQECSKNGWEFFGESARALFDQPRDESQLLETVELALYY